MNAPKFRLFRLTQPVKGASYLATWEWRGEHFDCLCKVEEHADGSRMFVGDRIDKVSAETMLRNAKVEGDRAALPQGVRDLVEQAADPELDDTAAIAEIGT